MTPREYRGELQGVDMGCWALHSPCSTKGRLNHIYTWFQPASDLSATDDLSSVPLLLWLQGGPGGPGWVGAFGEIGNWFVGGNTSDSEPHERCFSWCRSNHCLFVDQPVNTGFSFQTDKESGKTITDVTEVTIGYIQVQWKT